jgi:hypothetical protein
VRPQYRYSAVGDALPRLFGVGPVTGRAPPHSASAEQTHHDGHFDPGQRIANAIVVILLAALIGSGVALVTVSGGPAFVWLVRVHRWSTYAITPVLIGHIAIASGILPGYRGVARAMHLGGRLPVAVARRVWPGWLQRQTSAPLPTGNPDRRHRQLGALQRAEPPTGHRQVARPGPHDGDG